MDKRKLSLLIKKAKMGEDKSQVKLAFHYARINEYSNSFSWYLKAAEQGNPWAQNNVGMIYSKGLGIRKNQKRAFIWYKKAALNNCIPAFLNLGKSYLNRKCTPVNIDEAAHWLSKYEQFFAPNAISTLISPPEFSKKLIDKHFKDIADKLKIKGGWGYTKDTAVIIFNDDSNFSCEYSFVEQRVYEEFISLRPIGNKYHHLKWHLMEQKFICDEDRSYNKLTFEITGMHERDWCRLKNKWQKEHRKLRFDKAYYAREKELFTQHFVREFWFDISKVITTDISHQNFNRSN